MYKRLLTIVLMFGVLLTIVGGRSAVAQSGTTASITAVNIVTTSATNATLSFSYSSSLSPSQLRYQISYGNSVSYGTDTVTTDLDNTTTGSQSVTLLNLTAGTTYHFVVKLFNATSELLTTSADRTFTTASTGGDSTLLIIERIRVDCVSTSCNIYFATTKPAKVEARWDGNAQPAFTSYGTGTSEGTLSDTFRSIHIPAANQSALSPNTQYHYRLQAIGANNAVFTTGDLTFTTSASATDHVFATGQCSDGGAPATTVDIGSCLGSLYCSAAGTLVSDCTKCGFLCQTGKTCRNGTPNAYCDADRGLSGAPTQCNASSCYDARGVFTSPAPASCVSTWPKCNANTILKVRNDRGCNLWLSCTTSLQTDGTVSGPGENLCLNLGACNSLNANGQCNNYLPLGQCNNDPLRFCNNDSECQAGGTCNSPDPKEPTKALQNVTYQTPKDVAKLADLSGNIVAGLDWSEQGGANVIQGNLPWQLMRQIGGDAQIKNGDMEFRAPEVTPWVPVPTGLTPVDSLKIDFEDKDNGSNHVLTVEPVTQVLSSTGTQTPVAFSGAASDEFTAAPSEYYYAEARIRAEGTNPVVRVQFGHNDYTSFSVTTGTVITRTYVDVQATAAWQRVTLGPLKGMSGKTQLAFVCADNANCGKFQVDDVIVKPILQINTNPSYISPSCRLYPKSDSPSCDYADSNGVLYKGWKGYCLENDSQTGTCLSWWPVDIIKGESSIFGSEKAAGYQNRAPLYLCAQTADKSVGDDFGYNSPYVVAERGPNQVGLPACNPAGDACTNKDAFFNSSYTIAQCSDNPTSGACMVTPTGKTKGILEDEIASAIWYKSAGEVDKMKDIGFYNTASFQSTSPDNVANTQFSGSDDGGRVTWKQYREVAADGIYWRYVSDLPGDKENLNLNAITVYMKFDLTTHELLQYGLTEVDTTGDTYLGAAYRVKFTLKQICSKIVQVVDQNGTSSAFASRVGSSVYKVPDLNYGLATDLGPFGGALGPQAASDDPSSWPLLSSEQPNYTQFATPGQSRAGTPYACNGKCTDVICTYNNSTCLDNNGNLSSVLVRACQDRDADQDGTPDGECIGVVSANNSASERGQQNFSSTLTTGDSYFAQERIKRLFAQSFGVWTDLRCSNNADKACVVDGDCSGGTCSVRRGSYLKVPNSSSSVTGSSFVGWKPPSQLCEANPAYQPTNVCSSVSQQCKALLSVSGSSTTAYISAPLLGNDNKLKEEAMQAALSACGLSKVGTEAIPTAAGSVITGTPKLGGKQACTGVSAECPGGGTTGYQAGTTALFTTFTLTKPCSLSNGKYTCSGSCSSTASYINASKPAATPQSKYIRPAYVAGSQDDYCAIPPQVTNAKFINGLATTATITGGSGNIGIKFNTSADQEQVPLSNIRINWGDNQDEFAFPYAPRNDSSKPHIFSHTYVVNRGNTTNCKTTNGRTSCQFPIKIQVEDSWGWCNDPSPTPICLKDASKWYDTGLKVIVQP